MHCCPLRRAAGRHPSGWRNIIISGTTDHYGDSAVAVALAMGFDCVVAPGRNKVALAESSQRYDNRIYTVELTGDESINETNISKATSNDIDCVFNMLLP